MKGLHFQAHEYAESAISRTVKDCAVGSVQKRQQDVSELSAEVTLVQNEH